MDMVKKAAQLHTLIGWKLQELSDGEAVQMPDLYPLWEAGTEYPAQALVYEVIAPAGANIWEPHTVPAIWRLAEAAEEPDEIAPEYPAEEAV